MKKFIIILLFLVPFLSGCTKIDTNLSINNDKSANITVKIKTDKSIKPLELATVQANLFNFIDKSYTIKDKSNYKAVNFVAEKTVKNLNNNDLDLSSLGFKSMLESGRFIDVRKNFFVTSYNIHMVYDLPAMEKKIDYIKDVKQIPRHGLTPEYLQKYADKTLIPDVENVGRADFIANLDRNSIVEEEIIEYDTNEIEVPDNYKLFDINNFKSEFSIKLPYFASYNNAQKVKGFVYKWTIKNDEPTEIRLQYVVYSSYAISILLIGGILLLIYLAKRIHRHETLKRIGNNN